MYITLPTHLDCLKSFVHIDTYTQLQYLVSNDKRETDHVITPRITLNLQRLHIVKTYPYLMAVDRIVKYLKLFWTSLLETSFYMLCKIKDDDKKVQSPADTMWRRSHETLLGRMYNVRPHTGKFITNIYFSF